MPPKKDQPAGGPSSGPLLEDLVRALQDPAVVVALGDIFDKRVAAMAETITELRSDNNNPQRSLAAAERRIEALEAYSMRPDIIISGLPMSSFAEAAASTDP